MPDYRRSHISGGCYSLTVVPYHRLPILTADQSRAILRQAFIEVRAKYPFNLDAICLLPEHIHSFWTLPEQDSNYSVRWNEIKRLFTRDYLTQIGLSGPRSASPQVRGEAAV